MSWSNGLLSISCDTFCWKSASSLAFFTDRILAILLLVSFFETTLFQKSSGLFSNEALISFWTFSSVKGTSRSSKYCLSSSLPEEMSSCCSLRKKSLMLRRALGVCTNSNHSAFGNCFLEVMISTWSPLLRGLLTGVML